MEMKDQKKLNRSVIDALDGIIRAIQTGKAVPKNLTQSHGYQAYLAAKSLKLADRPRGEVTLTLVLEFPEIDADSQSMAEELERMRLVLALAAHRTSLIEHSGDAIEEADLIRTGYERWTLAEMKKRLRELKECGD